MIHAISLRIVAVLFVAALALSLTGCGGNSKITKSNYDKINDGMTEQQVEAILGKLDEASAKKAAAVDDAGKPIIVPAAPKVTYWREETKWISITFLNGKVMAKAQNGVFSPTPNGNAEEQWEKTKKGLADATQHLETVRVYVTVLAFVLFVVTTWRLLWKNESLCACELPAYCIFWTVVPPIYFFIEYYFLFEDSGKMDSTLNTIFTNGQQTGRNIWLGVAAFVLFSGNAIASRQEKKRSRESQSSDKEKEIVQRIQDEAAKKA